MSMFKQPTHDNGKFFEDLKAKKALSAFNTACDTGLVPHHPKGTTFGLIEKIINLAKKSTCICHQRKKNPFTLHPCTTTNVNFRMRGACQVGEAIDGGQMGCMGPHRPHGAYTIPKDAHAWYEPCTTRNRTENQTGGQAIQNRVGYEAKRCRAQSHPYTTGDHQLSYEKY